MEGKPQFLLMVLVPAFTHSAAAQGGTIANATYGTGNNRVNVTSRVQSLAQNGVLNFQVTIDFLGLIGGGLLHMLASGGEGDTAAYSKLIGKLVRFRDGTHPYC